MREGVLVGMAAIGKLREKLVIGFATHCGGEDSEMSAGWCREDGRVKVVRDCRWRMRRIDKDINQYEIGHTRFWGADPRELGLPWW